jgi:hypothetical protein
MKHLAIHNNKKVAVLFRTVPGEPTNALIVDHEQLPEPIKSNFKQCLESKVGQNALSLSDAANQFSVANGDKLLAALHIGNYIKKVETKDVVLTPNDKTNLPLNELNNIIDGAGGAKQAPVTESPSTMGTIDLNPGAPVVESVDTSSVLSDEQVATDLRNQANGLQREADRMLAEAESLHPAPPKKRGRPAKTTA